VAALQNMVIQLRKICQHPFVFQSTDNEIMDHLAVKQKKQYYNDDENEFTAAVLSRAAGKFELLDRILPKMFATGHKVLIFFQWTSVMNLAEEFMKLRGWKNCRLDGSTSADERQRLLSTFNDPSYGYQVFLLSTRAGGLGLNLQSADTVILYDSDYNPHADQQAQDRAHRIGQKKEVRVLRFVSTGTVEEGIVEIAKRKLALDGQIIQAGKFDGHSSAEERDNFLRTLLDRENEDTEEDAEPDEDTLNEIIARSEEEMELFTKMDEERKQREISQLPRLITKEELPEPYTREYPPASELAIEAIEEDFGRGQRSRTTVNYQEQNDLDDLLMEPMDDDAEPLPARRNRKPKGQLPDTKLDQDHSRPVSPAKLSAFEEQDLEGSAGPSNRGRKRKEPSTTASNADEETKPAKVSANRRSSTRIRGSHSDHFLFLGNRSDLDSRMMAGLLLRLMSLLRCAPYRTECGITRTRMVLISCGLSRQKFPKR
jgi:ATP-dependent helicase STH1/SNF2